MNLDTLNIFVDTMRLGNFADVARRHELAPSSVSRAIAGLEKDLGVRLFQRTTRKLTPTEAAAAFYHRIHPALSEIDAARQAARDQTRQPGGTLRINWLNAPAPEAAPFRWAFDPATFTAKLVLITDTGTVLSSDMGKILAGSWAGSDRVRHQQTPPGKAPNLA